MVTNGHDTRTDAIRSAVQYLHSIPSPSDEYDQVESKVLRSRPDATGQELVNLLMDALIQQCSQGGIY